MSTEIPTWIFSQNLWYNAQADKTSIQFSCFFEKNVHHVSQLFSENGSGKKEHEFKAEHDLRKLLLSMGATNKLCFKKIEKIHESTANFIINDHNTYM